MKLSRTLVIFDCPFKRAKIQRPEDTVVSYSFFFLSSSLAFLVNCPLPQTNHQTCVSFKCDI